MSDITLVGISHQQAPLALLERLAWTPDGQAAALASLARRFDEGVILSTCNRVEVYAAAPAGDLFDWLVADRGIAAAALAPYVKIVSGRPAVQHLYRVAAGLESALLGEPEIMGQVRAALDRARAEGRAGPLLDSLFRQALKTAREIRHRTGISRSPASLVSAALMVARDAFGDLAGQPALVIGAGKLGRATLRTLRSAGVTPLCVVNRTEAAAAEVALETGANVLPWSARAAAVAESAVVINCAAADGPLFAPATLPGPMGRAVWIDLAMPRALPVVDRAEIQQFDLAAVQAVAEAARSQRHSEVARAEALLEPAVDRFLAWQAARAVGPAIAALRAEAEHVRDEEIATALRRLGPLSEREAAIVRALGHRLTNRLLHGPISELKEKADPGRTRPPDLVGLPRDYAP